MAVPVAQSPVDLLRKQYLDKHERQVRPLQDLLKGASMIAAVAAAVFASASMSLFPSFVIGMSVLSISTGLSKYFVRWFADNTNLEAAEALKAPGFFDEAQLPHLASAQNILEAYHRYCDQA